MRTVALVRKSDFPLNYSTQSVELHFCIDLLIDVRFRLLRAHACHATAQTAQTAPEWSPNPTPVETKLETRQSDGHIYKKFTCWQLFSSTPRQKADAAKASETLNRTANAKTGTA